MEFARPLVGVGVVVLLASALSGCAASPESSTPSLEASCDDLWNLVEEGGESIELMSSSSSSASAKVHLAAFEETAGRISELAVHEDLADLKSDIVESAEAVVQYGGEALEGNSSEGLDTATAEYIQALLAGQRACDWQ